MDYSRKNSSQTGDKGGVMEFAGGIEEREISGINYIEKEVEYSQECSWKTHDVEWISVKSVIMFLFEIQ